jgi:hypothetical protein
MLEEAKHAILVSPVIIAMAVIARENAGRGGSDLLRDLEAPLGDTSLQLLKPHAHAIHGFGALAVLECLAFFGMDNEDPHARLLGGDLLDQGLGRRCLLTRRDADRTFDPSAGCALDIVEHLAAAAAIAADDVAMTALAQEIEVVARHHAAVADEHDALEPEALLKIAQDLGNRLGIAPIAPEDMVSNRPAIDQDQADQHLRVARLAVAAVAMSALIGRSAALEIGRRQIIEHHVDLQ